MNSCERSLEHVMWTCDVVHVAGNDGYFIVKIIVSAARMDHVKYGKVITFPLAPHLHCCTECHQPHGGIGGTERRENPGCGRDRKSAVYSCGKG